MESLTRLVTESLARHGFDRPLDYRRLQWSRWFRCESHHSLLFVPSKPGVFALAEEIADFSSHGATNPAHVQTAASTQTTLAASTDREGDDFSRAIKSTQDSAALAAEAARQPEARRMLAVTQFFEDDDMAFVLDRMLSRENPMRVRLVSGRYFVRFVVIDDQTQRRSICNALNQWLSNSAEKASGIGPHFATSLELTPATEYIPQPDERQQSLFSDPTPDREGHDFSRAESTAKNQSALASGEITGNTMLANHPGKSNIPSTPPHLDSGAATNIHCPSPLPSGF